MRILCHRQKGGAAVEQSAPLGLAEHPGTCPGDVRCPDSASFWHPGGAYFAGREELQACPGLPEKVRQALEDKDLSQADQILAQCEALGIWVLTCQDAAYPQRLGQLDSAPLRALWPGKAAPDGPGGRRGPGGGRQASPYGIMAAGRLGLDLARQGALVVSGMAQGWDAAALRGALRGGGRVVSVLGSGIDVIYPAGHGDLYEDVAAAGALLSEYPRAPRPPAPIFLCVTASSPA